MIQALCFVLKFFGGVASKFLREGLYIWVPSLEEWLLIWLLLLHLEFVMYFFYTVALMLLDSSLVLCQVC